MKFRFICCAVILMAATSFETAAAQAGIVTGDSVTIVPGKAFQKGGLYRALFGDNYRDEWTTRIKLPVLDLGRTGGGLRGHKLGGGKQTRSLRLIASDSVEYVFRPIYKAGTNLPEKFRGTIVWDMVRDEGSGSHPAATVATGPMMDAVGVRHPFPKLVVMPDDPRLGEFRSEFAGVVGEIEDYPKGGEYGRHPADARDVIDSDEFLQRLNRSAGNRVDARAMLTARMVDILVGDNDRHPDQWKWALFSGGADSIWTPIPRDRDKAFVTYEGNLLNLARKMIPSLIKFQEAYPDITALFENATDFDRRMLGGLDRQVWDSVARSVRDKVTDQVIDRSMSLMPPEYAASKREIGTILRARRNHLPEAALGYYEQLFKVADIHGTDAPDNASVNRETDGSVTVQIRRGGGTPWFNRRFVPSETMEVRLYLHGGDDSALVTGSSGDGVKVRVIGGNGRNALGDRTGVARLYDVGMTTGVIYGIDTLHGYVDEATEFNREFNRRPWVLGNGGVYALRKDHGSSIKPVVGLKTGHGLGIVPRVGIARYGYGFRRVPYSSMLQGTVAYATGTGGFKADVIGDKRFISSDVHIPVAAMMSQLEVIQFRGFGNDVEDDDSRFFDVSQTMWQARPAIGYLFRPGSDVSFGPVVRYTTTDSTRNRFISASRPYGFRTFGQAGAQLALHYENRMDPDTMKPRLIVDLNGSGFPAMWDANSAYESIEGSAVSYINMPLPKRPVLALRGGGKKLFGDFPYFDAAFLGGGSSFRIEHRQRYAGDASLYGSAELRYPIADFPFILPLNVGAIGFGDAGRVYVNGDSPGGWHSAVGGGFWIGALNPGLNVNVLLTNRSDHRVLVNLGFAY